MNHVRISGACLCVGIALSACAASSTSSVSPSPTTSAASAQPSTASPTIVLTEWKVQVASTMKTGKITFTITNAGTIPHELLVFKSDLDPAAYPKDSDGNIIEDGTGITLLSDGDNIDPGASQTRTVDLATPGRYLFVCNIPSHFKMGMFTVVTVTE
jgi:uncharacterized cupredoxin-like copper-binding protein